MRLRATAGRHGRLHRGVLQQGYLRGVHQAHVRSGGQSRLREPSKRTYCMQPSATCVGRKNGMYLPHLPVYYYVWMDKMMDDRRRIASRGVFGFPPHPVTPGEMVLKPFLAPSSVSLCVRRTTHISIELSFGVLTGSLRPSFTVATISLISKRFLLSYACPCVECLSILALRYSAPLLPPPTVPPLRLPSPHPLAGAVARLILPSAEDSAIQAGVHEEESLHQGRRTKGHRVGGQGTKRRVAR